jgi:transposase
MAALETQLDTVDAELRRFARADERCRALQSIYGIGPILACHLLVEIGEARRFRRAEQISRLAASTPSSTNRARRAAAATSPRPAHRICAGRWSKRPCTRTAQPPPTSPSTAPPASDATPRWRD